RASTLRAGGRDRADRRGGGRHGLGNDSRGAPDVVRPGDQARAARALRRGLPGGVIERLPRVLHGARGDREQELRRLRDALWAGHRELSHGRRARRLLPAGGADATGGPLGASVRREWGRTVSRSELRTGRETRQGQGYAVARRRASADFLRAAVLR